MRPRRECTEISACLHASYTCLGDLFLMFSTLLLLRSPKSLSHLRAEYSLFPPLFTSRALCGRVGFLLVEWHLVKLPRSKRRAGMVLRDALQPILNASCSALGFEPPRVVNDVVPENNLQVDVIGSGCRAYCYNNRYCTRSDCTGWYATRRVEL